MIEQGAIPTVEDFQKAFGIEPDEDPAPQEEPATNEEPQEEPEPEKQESGDETPAEEPKQEPQPQPQPQQQPAQQDKANQAFARMRTENAQMQKTLAAVAQVLGVDPKQPMEQLAQQLQDQAMGALAKANNMDPAILKRLDQLEAINTEYNDMKLQRKADEAEKTIMEKYGATQDDMMAFAQDLLNDNVDFRNPNFDFETEFIKRNFEKISKRAIEQAVQAEQNRSAKASGASKPESKQGQEDKSEPHDINSVEELDKFLSESLK